MSMNIQRMLRWLKRAIPIPNDLKYFLDSNRIGQGGDFTFPYIAAVL